MPVDLDAISIEKDDGEWEAHVDDSTGRTYYANKMCVCVCNLHVIARIPLML